MVRNPAAVMEFVDTWENLRRTNSSVVPGTKLLITEISSNSNCVEVVCYHGTNVDNIPQICRVSVC